MEEKIPIEELLSAYYKDLYKEYKSEKVTYHRALFDAYVDKETQQRLKEETINDFHTRWCKPYQWVYPINLWVNVYEKIRVYFYSMVDLRPHVSFLMQDDNFKDLIKVAFFITETIHPKS